MPGKKRTKAFIKETAQSCFEASTVRTTEFKKYIYLKFLLFKNT